MTKRLLAIVAGLVALTIVGCDYDTASMQDKNNAERTATTVEPTTTTSTAPPPATTSTTQWQAEDDRDASYDADTSDNRRFDPDTFDCTTMGNAVCEPEGIPVNGPNAPPAYDHLPCYLDFPDMVERVTPDSEARYAAAREAYC
jgi:hypothetical protein